MSNPKTFEVDLSKLSSANIKAVELLKQVGELVHEIWLKQVDESTNNAKFYYDGATVAEITEAAKKNREILSAYTLVRKNEKGEIVAVPYAVEYAEELKKITVLLDEVSKTVDDKESASYFAKLAKNYAKNDFEEALVTYISTPETLIHVLMGPIETYLDTLMGKKKAFQFNLRVLNSEQHEDVNNILKLASNWGVLKPTGSTAKELPVGKVKISVVDVLMFSGRQANTFTASTNLPDDSGLIKKHGTKIVFYINSLHAKFDTLLLKHIDRVLLDEVVYDLDELKRAYLRLVTLHEVAEAAIQYEDARARLKGYMDEMREVNAYLLGLKSAKYHVFSGYFTTDQFKQIYLCYILYCFDQISRMETDRSVASHARGCIVFLNYLLEKGAMAREGAKFKFDMAGLAHVDILAEIVGKIFAEGTANDAKALFDKYSDIDGYKS